MAQEIEPKFKPAYIPADIPSLLREWNEGEQVGTTSRVMELDDIFKWMPGTINGWYGWANDGKGTFFDFLAVMNAMFDGGKFCMLKQEDMSSTKYKDQAAKITANRIHKSLVWTYTGKTPYAHYAKRYGVTQLQKDEYMQALNWMEDHFFVIYPQDRRHGSVLQQFKFMYEKYGCNKFLIDPWKSIILQSDRKNLRGDELLNEAFIEQKEFALTTNSAVHNIAHPKSISDVMDKNGKYKVVNQFMIAGGAAWDNNMDSQYSIYRPERHLNPSDTKVHFYNLKQRNAEEVLAKRGMYDHIRFDPITKRYFFNGICPLDGSTYENVVSGRKAWNKTAPIDFTEPKKEEVNQEDLPF